MRIQVSRDRGVSELKTGKTVVWISVGYGFERSDGSWNEASPF